MERNGIDFRCDICRRTVDHDTCERARHAWQPLIICDTCLREADAQPGHNSQALTAAS